jgi:hypothetical protein
LITLRGAVLTTLTADGKTERILEHLGDYQNVLLEDFKLELQEAPELWQAIWSRHLEWLK